MIEFSKKQEAILADAIFKYGIDSQMGILQEECAELIVAVSKLKRKLKRKMKESPDGRIFFEDHVIGYCEEEAADVLIMIKQMTIKYGSDNIQQYADMKMKRLENMMNEESQKERNEPT